MLSVGHTPRRSSVGIMSDPLDLTKHIPHGTGDTKKQGYVEGNLKIANILETSCDVMCLRFNQDGSDLAVGQTDGVIKIYSPDNGQCLYTLRDNEPDPKRRKLPVTSIRFQLYEDSDKTEHKHILMATYASGLIKYWHYTSSTCLHTIDEGRQTLSSAFSPNGHRFITCGADPKINLYDARTKQRLRCLEPSDSRDVMNGHRARVFSAQYHPTQPHMFVTGGWDDTLQFWDDRSQHAVRKIYGPHICGDALDIDPLHNHVITGSWRKQLVLQIWDFDSGEKIKDVPQDPLHGSQLYCAQWLGKENIVCGGYGHNMARVIDRGTLNTVGQLVDLPNAVFCIDNDRQLKPKIAAGTGTKTYVLKTEKSQ